MTSQDRRKRSRTSEVGARPTQSHSPDISGNSTPSCDEIRLRAYEIYLEHGSVPGNELDRSLQADQFDGRVLQAVESTDIEGLG
jgi:Protein of unknown function (DUF2934)